MADVTPNPYASAFGGVQKRNQPGAATPGGLGQVSQALNVARVPTASRSAAFGSSPDETEEQRRARTGIDRGGTGYVSGQVAPGTQGGAAPGTVPTGTPPPAGSSFRSTPAPVNPASAVGVGVAPAGPPNAAAALGIGNVPQPGGGTTTVRSGLTAPNAAPGGGGGGGGTSVPGGTGSTTSTGTQNGYSPLGPLAGPVNSIPVFGPIVTGLTSTSEANLSPTIAAQNAAMGLGANLDLERYNYRPGEAPAQDRVALDLAQANETRARQQAALDALTAASEGRVPSAAEIQMREEAGRNTAAVLGQARALGGRSAGGAARAGTLASGDLLARNAVAGNALRATEQANARNALIQALGGVRGQDIDTSQANANLGQAANANNLTAQVQTNEQAEKHRLALLDAQLKALGIGTTAAGDTVGASAKNAEAENKTKGGVVSGIASALGL